LFRKLDNRWTTLRGLKLCRVFWTIALKRLG
jgi:hypothetical protein